ncbi:hypothetical protein BV898_07897 [Hypsibius exemplaris]|uniref:Uncharacterized protein n=1 Tax=Hypsibius exemplaris TaxID=2072580 RepID=A0A1W0WRY3_HYPEX|nr:hypothetical protein BV898_07897 [Hypsibius exemplaris]
MREGDSGTDHGDGGKSVTITENLAGFAERNLPSLWLLEGVGPSRDTISLDFVDARRFLHRGSQPFPLMDIYPASAPLPITVSPDVLACSACTATSGHPSRPLHLHLKQTTNGQGVVLCRNADNGLEARRQIQVRWHPTPEFSQPSVLTVSDTPSRGTPLLVLRPDKNYPYTLQYAVDENPAVNVNINTGIVTLKSALTAG